MIKFPAFGIADYRNLWAGAAFNQQGLIGEQVVRAAQKNGLILRPIGESVIFAPPFIITKAEIDDMFARTAKVLDEIEAIVEKDGLRAAAVTAAAE